MGTLPYSQRLDILNLTTLAERRIRGDLIETFKAIKGLSNLGNMFNVSRSGLNLVSRYNFRNGNYRVRNAQRKFLPERVICFWNKLPVYVKNSDTINMFKNNLESFKKSSINNMYSNSSPDHFWEVSNEVLRRIEGPSYLTNKSTHNAYLRDNPYVAKKRFINLHSTGLY